MVPQINGLVLGGILLITFILTDSLVRSLTLQIVVPSLAVPLFSSEHLWSHSSPAGNRKNALRRAALPPFSCLGVSHLPSQLCLLSLVSSSSLPVLWDLPSSPVFSHIAALSDWIPDSGVCRKSWLSCCPYAIRTMRKRILFVWFVFLFLKRERVDVFSPK